MVIILAQFCQLRVRASSSSSTLPERVIRLTFSSCMSKSRPICSSMVSRRMTRRPSALILTMAGSRLTTASGLSRSMAWMIGRVSSLACRAMNTDDMCFSSGFHANLVEAHLEGSQLLFHYRIGLIGKHLLDHRQQRSGSAITPLPGPGDQLLAVVLGFGGGSFHHRVHPFAGFIEPVALELTQHGDRRATFGSEFVVDDAFVDQRVQQAVQRHVLRHEHLEGITDDQGVFSKATQCLPGLVVLPQCLALLQCLGATQLQTETGQVLGNTQVVHG